MNHQVESQSIMSPHKHPNLPNLQTTNTNRQNEEEDNGRHVVEE